jgi:benzodiazapine receptor
MQIEWMKLLTAIFVCQAIGLFGARYTRPALKPWYASLRKPFFTPPNWLFAPAWITLYFMMAIAFYLIWIKDFAAPGVKPAVFAFALQLFLNSLWSYIFFGLKLIGYGVLEIISLWISIAVCLVLFLKVSIPAGLLLIPYLVWVTFATALNFAIWKLNPGR